MTSDAYDRETSYSLRITHDGFRIMTSYPFTHSFSPIRLTFYEWRLARDEQYFLFRAVRVRASDSS